MRYLLVAAAVSSALGAAAAPRNMPYSAAKPVLDALRAELLPTELRGRSPASVESSWSAWVARHDAEIRARVTRGEEDSVVTLLLFGVTFTRQPRYSFAPWATDRAPQGNPEEIVAADPIVKARIADLARAISTPGANERIQLAKRIVDRTGIDPPEFLLYALKRMLREYDEYFTQTVPGQTLFRNRGLSTDTSIYAAFAIERTLSDLASQGLLSPRSVHRVALIGPGLDFADKQEGLDFYPLQTIQPFLLIDSLRRLELAGPEGVQLTTYDVSLQVNRHLEEIRGRARSGNGYTLHLPRDSTQRWLPDLVTYWQRAAERIGVVTAAAAPPSGLERVAMRAVTIHPEVIEAISPRDLNIVLQTDSLPDDQRFDLVIATNVLIYYDVFEQSLALANISQLLRRGGLLLTNTALFELPGVPMRAVGGTKVAYMNGTTDGVVWYQREPR